MLLWFPPRRSVRVPLAAARIPVPLELRSRYSFAKRQKYRTRATIKSHDQRRDLRSPQILAAVRERERRPTGRRPAKDARLAVGRRARGAADRSGRPTQVEFPSGPICSLTPSRARVYPTDALRTSRAGSMRARAQFSGRFLGAESRLAPRADSVFAGCGLAATGAWSHAHFVKRSVRLAGCGAAAVAEAGWGWWGWG